MRGLKPCIPILVTLLVVVIIYNALIVCDLFSNNDDEISACNELQVTSFDEQISEKVNRANNVETTEDGGIGFSFPSGFVPIPVKTSSPSPAPPSNTPLPTPTPHPTPIPIKGLPDGEGVVLYPELNISREMLTTIDGSGLLDYLLFHKYIVWFRDLLIPNGKTSREINEKGVVITNLVHAERSIVVEKFKDGIYADVLTKARDLYPFVSNLELEQLGGTNLLGEYSRCSSMYDVLMLDYKIAQYARFGNARTQNKLRQVVRVVELIVEKVIGGNMDANALSVIKFYRDFQKGDAVVQLITPSWKRADENRGGHAASVGGLNTVYLGLAVLENDTKLINTFFHEFAHCLNSIQSNTYIPCGLDKHHGREWFNILQWLYTISGYKFDAIGYACKSD